jgi:hypothetical protein
LSQVTLYPTVKGYLAEGLGRVPRIMAPAPILTRLPTCETPPPSTLSITLLGTRNSLRCPSHVKTFRKMTEVVSLPARHRVFQLMPFKCERLFGSVQAHPSWRLYVCPTGVPRSCETTPPLRPPQDPMYSPTVGYEASAVFNERGTPVCPTGQHADPSTSCV